MGEDDLRGVFLLGRELFGEGDDDPWDETSLAALLAVSLEYSLVALRGKATAGFIIPELPTGRAARIRWIACREGDEIPVAAPLIEAFLAALPGISPSGVRIMIDPENFRLIELCRKFGFTELKHPLIMGNFFPKHEQ